MGRPRKNDASDAYRAITPEAREQQMINYAENLAEQKLRDGTASSQIIVHYLNLASTKAKMELSILEQKRELMEAQTKAIQSTEQIEQMYEKAIHAMREYQGMEEEVYDEY